MNESQEHPEGGNKQTIEIIERVKTFYMAKESDRAFAHRCGIPQTTYAGYASGLRSIHLDALVAISRTTGASLEWLVTGSGPRLRQDLVNITATASSHSSTAVSQSGNAVAVTAGHQQPPPITPDGFSSQILAALIQNRDTLNRCLEQLRKLSAI